ncbi:dienelactone hydrolase family protein [Nocardioides mangrovicus]|uniref:Dienelactone hydrolase family protein n=1 Tax=Nocardioides mangrovicus TaxID=2478913 RepID=A0A3L8P477_9ACTN|nr:dienelactone hydrolase family protein [Nocardioides mangrovicus]RLV49921.1 dienelactone hydrolase family protein [Nocardioides mangrovicus]
MELTEIPAADGSAEAYLARPEGGSGPGVLFLIDAIGLRPRIAQMCDRIASWGYVVLAPNVFYREGTAAETSPDADLREPGERERFFEVAGPRIGRLTADLAERDLTAYLAELRGTEGVTEGPLGATGYCMGARLAVRAATGDEGVAAVGGFHGAGLVTDDPDSPHLGLGRTRAEFCFGHADQDHANPAEAIAALGEALAEHGLSASNEVYPDAPHGYTMADTSAYQEAGTERHFAELEALFARTLDRPRS